MAPLPTFPHNTSLAALPALAAQAPPVDAAVTADASTEVTVGAHNFGAPPLLTDFLACDPAATDKSRRRRRSPGPHERRLHGVPEDTSTSDYDGNPWPSEDARSSDCAFTD